MDTRQYGPALFPTVKQVRSLLDERLPAAEREEGESAAGATETRRSGEGRR